MTTTTATETEIADAVSLELPERRPVASGETPGRDVDEPPANSDLDGTTILKLASASFSFFVAGVNDGSIGALIPFLIREYEISAAVVSAIYAASFLGWLFSAVSNTHLCQYLDLGSVLALGAAFQIVAHALRAWQPSFGLLVFSFWLISVGQAYQDAHANTFVAGVKTAHRWLGLVHAMYMAGCLIGPIIATAIASVGSDSRWYLFYTVPLGLGVINLALTLVAFRDSVTLAKRNLAVAQEGDPTQHLPVESQEALKVIRATLKMSSMWLLSLFYFFYLGAVITAGGWVVEYLVDVRGGDLSRMGYVGAGYSGGALLGRLLLAEPTFRLGERKMVFTYSLTLCRVPNIIAASIAISLLGFFSGPLFATGISVGSKLFPPDLRSSALAFVFVFAQMGGSLFPIVTGVLASHKGVEVLQPMLVGLLGATAMSWLLVPKPKSTVNPGLHQE